MSDDLLTTPCLMTWCGEFKKRSWYHTAVTLNQSSESTRLSLPGEVVQGPPRVGRSLDSLCCSSLCCKRRRRQKCHSRLCRSSHHLSVAGCMFCWLPQASPSWLRSKSNGNRLESIYCKQPVTLVKCVIIPFRGKCGCHAWTTTNK